MQKEYEFNNCTIELTPNRDRTQWLLCFNGFLSYYYFAKQLNISNKEVEKILEECKVFTINGNYYVDNPENVEHLIVLLKLIAGVLICS